MAEQRANKIKTDRSGKKRKLKDSKIPPGKASRIQGGAAEQLTKSNKEQRVK